MHESLHTNIQASNFPLLQYLQCMYSNTSDWYALAKSNARQLSFYLSHLRKYMYIYSLSVPRCCLIICLWSTKKHEYLYTHNYTQLISYARDHKCISVLAINNAYILIEHFKSTYKVLQVLKLLEPRSISHIFQ